jgi:hypothetical protein
LKIAISVYVLVAIVKKPLNLPRSLYETLQTLSLTLCEQMPLAQIDVNQNPSEAHNQMNLLTNVGALLCAYNSAICEVASQ